MWKTAWFMRSSTRQTRDLIVFAMFAAMMCGSQIAMRNLPGIHPLGLLMATLTLVYRWRALIPIYVYILVYGAIHGFSMWWLPYIYLWLPLWGMFMIAGNLRLPKTAQTPIFMILCGLHGLSWGAMYAPAEALFWGFTFEQTIAWIIAGLPFDAVHAASNFGMGIMIVPLAQVTKRLAATSGN